MAVEVDKNLCPQNHSCPVIKVCPVSALKQIGYNAPIVDKDKCIDCGECVRYCGMGAIKILK